jgi:ribosomal protein S18 acetylase RimI-like enzyme
VSAACAHGGLSVTDSPEAGAFQAIYQALEADSVGRIGPMRTRFLVVPLHGDAGGVCGGLWGCTNFRWLHIQMLVVPAALRGRGWGAAMVRAAEAEARARGCLGAHVDSFSFQAVGFYEKLGYTRFGVLADFPPGYSQHYFQKRLAA